MIIVDEYFEEMKEYFEKRGEAYNRILTEYCLILRKIKQDGICEGETANALEQFIKLAERTTEVANGLGGAMVQTIESFMEAIDTEDQYLY